MLGLPPLCSSGGTPASASAGASAASLSPALPPPASRIGVDDGDAATALLSTPAAPPVADASLLLGAALLGAAHVDAQEAHAAGAAATDGAADVSCAWREVDSTGAGAGAGAGGGGSASSCT
mmetsp:Transcript_44351/g.103694  ORF Transcript_44351/g.103694 Transcript_44351/m.103694 type:complete len:122 (-) Transcript_44351:753-1118(-)